MPRARILSSRTCAGSLWLVRAFASRLNSTACAVIGIVTLTAAPCWAIVAGHIDNFNDETTQNWRVGLQDVFPVNEPNFGPDGVGDHALWMATASAGGSNPMLLVFNMSSSWTGNWTAAGVSRIELDVLGPTSNNFSLAMRLGIVGPDGGPFSQGGGDTYVTPAFQVPSDGQWHRISFDVLAEDFIPIGGNDVDDALADMRHFRILHNPLESFIGADTTSGGGEFYLDNIQALSAIQPPTTTGDYNQNGVVDAADYVLWRKTLNETVAMPGDGADGNRSGAIDPGDYDFWRARFGNIVTMPGLGAIAAVPEPGSAFLLLAGLAAIPLTNRTRRSPVR